MIEQYKDSQPLFYSIINNSIRNGFLSHAYLFVENNNDNAYDMVMSFVKEILSYGKENDRELISKLVDDGNYPEISVISPDGMFIKKEQLINLQNDFSKKAITGEKRIYIIRDADKMRKEAENSMLKFLEEPEDDIIAILMTNNINNILDTIVSRCQVIKFNYVGNKILNAEIFNTVLDFIIDMENNGYNTIIDSKRLWYDKINLREDNYTAIGYMIDIYYNMLHSKTISNYEFEYMDKLINIINKNSIESLNSKLNILVECRDNIKNNVNISLLIDSLIIRLVGVK